MKNTSLCYLSSAGRVLMLHRTKKEHDENGGKWIGVGGKFEEGESPEECMLREFREETGLRLTSFRFRGIVTFVSDLYGTQYMHLFTADGFEGELADCAEGDLAWVPEEAVNGPNLWEGDRIFLALLKKNEPFFSLKLCYRGDALKSVFLNGKQQTA